MKGQALKSCICALAMFAMEGMAHAENPSEIRIYTLADEGLLSLFVPKHWSDKHSQLAVGLPRTIRFSSNEDTRFEMLFSARWSGRQDASVVDPSFVLSVVAHGAKLVAPQSVEDELEVQRLSTNNGEAYVFSATDKDPGDGEYRYMTQGAVNVQGMICTFTILTDEQNAQAIAEAIEMVRTASFVSN